MTTETDPPRLLLVDDDEGFVEVLAAGLEAKGFVVETENDGEDALKTIARSRPDLLVCDVNMPQLDGFSVCRELREAGDDLPIILLTTRDNDIDETLGLQLGADDYVTKPFSRRVLVARIEALLRRDALRRGAPAHGEVGEEEVREVGPLQANLARLEARYHDELLDLTVTEFRLLVGLIDRPEIVLSRSRLLEIMREDADTFVHERMVDSYIGRLRRKLGAISDDFDAIETVVGVGYRWRPDAL